MYKKTKFEGVEQDFIIRLPDNSLIPLEPTNRHYQEYLDWLNQGNTPEPADEGQQE